jgi:hypothetical protein
MRMEGRTGDIDRTALRFALARIKQDSTPVRHRDEDGRGGHREEVNRCHAVQVRHW